MNSLAVLRSPVARFTPRLKKQLVRGQCPPKTILEKARKGVIPMSQTTYQVILSTDGKHTVIATSDDPIVAREALAWARSTYDLVVKTYGLKGEHNHKNGNGDVSEVVPTCAIHGVPMVRVEGKHGAFWSCHERNEDGSFCSYRPNGK